MAKQRTSIPVTEVAARHTAGESLRSLAVAYGTSVHTLSARLLAEGFTPRSRSEATALANATREQGPSKAQGQVTANRNLRNRKRDIVRAYRARGCSRCGEDHPAVLDLHHRDPNTKHACLRKQQQRDGYRKGSSGRGWGYMSFSALEAELAKCEVLCSNCHRKETWEARVVS